MQLGLVLLILTISLEVSLTNSSPTNKKGSGNKKDVVTGPRKPNKRLKSESAKCGWKPFNRQYPAIKLQIHGKDHESVENEWPWLLRIETEKETEEEHERGKTARGCGATLIEVCNSNSMSDIAITAAHCVTWKNKTGGTIKVEPNELTVYAGHHDWEKEVKGIDPRFPVNPRYPLIVQVVDIIVHDWFSYKNFPLADIAIIKLEKPVGFISGEMPTASIYPICLPFGKRPVHESWRMNQCYAAGWGQPDSKSPHSSRYPQHFQMKGIQPEKCELKIFSNKSVVGKSFLCTQPNEWIKKHFTTSGDSGGPLMCKDYRTGLWMLEGVISGAQNVPWKWVKGFDIHTNVHYYSAWIQNKAFQSSVICSQCGPGPRADRKCSFLGFEHND